MKIYKNAQGLLDISEIRDGSTVQHLFTAIDHYAASSPLPCNSCLQNCCDKQFYIEMDRISALHLAEKKRLSSYILSTLKIVYPPDNSVQILLTDGTFPCHYLNREKQCSVYTNRPAACRLYSCEKRSEKYLIVNRTVVAALHHALIADFFENIIQHSTDPEICTMLTAPLAWLRATPAYGKKTYNDILLKDCVRFDMEGEGISKKELQVYRELLTMN